MIVEKELQELNKYIIDSLNDDKNKIADDINDYLQAKSKRLRPMLVFLFANALNVELDERVYHLACSVELVHNSTLVHDDILDDADTRRGRVSLNYKLGNSLSVLAGDILLSIALRELVKCGKVEAIDSFAESIYLMCKGEINQNFTIGKLPTMEEYIKKSEYKTAELFKAPLTALCHIAGIKEIDKVRDFARDFGIAFQIKDDILNVMQTDNTKPILSDIHNGIFTAPVIFLNEDVKIEGLNETEIIEKLQSDKKYLKKTIDLIREYAQKAVKSIDFIQDSPYKQELITLAENLYKVEINE